MDLHKSKHSFIAINIYITEKKKRKNVWVIVYQQQESFSSRADSSQTCSFSVIGRKAGIFSPQPNFTGRNKTHRGIL